MPELKKEDLIKKCSLSECEVPSVYPERHENQTLVGVIACEKCGGQGVILTDQGEVIRDFVRWLKHTKQI